MKNYFGSLVLIFLLVSGINSKINAQKVFKAHVFDKETSIPLNDVKVNVFNKNFHVHTNENGYFKINKLNKGDTLLLSALGYKEKMYIVGNPDTTERFYLSKEIYEINKIIISSNIKQLNSIANIDLAIKPVNTSQQLLTTIPGLFISQHSGGGKAEQIFLRGIDNDHGTDINISADGIPVNMVSHAHGQGYADCHFIIPETVKKIDFGKGPYYADKGDFTTSGYVNFETFNKIEQNKFSLELGQFNTLRMLGMFNLINSSRTNSYIATEYFLTDGPFVASQNFNRFNVFGKYNTWINPDNYINVEFSDFSSKWDASGQIPQRAVNEGLISRFGAIDSTEGGITGRTNFSVKHIDKIDDNNTIENFFFYSKYNFELYSNFTFFMNDTANGDQIRQKENRNVYGFSSILKNHSKLGNYNLASSFGSGMRYDQIFNTELSHTLHRKITLEQKSLGNINESNLYLFSDFKLNTGKWLFDPSVRVDFFKFDYNDKLETDYQTKSVQKSIISPKFNIIFSPNDNWQFYLKTGKGFHSNDARDVVVEKGLKTLPAAYGSDLGFISKNFNKMIINAALWYLYMDQEFVYSGDEAVVEPSGRTQRYGADLSIRYQLNNWLFSSFDFNYAVPRFLDLPKGKNYVPLAPIFTSTGGIFIRNLRNFSAGINYRYMADRPAIEDYSFTAKGYFVTDLVADYALKNFAFGISIQNLFNVDWREAQFLTVTQLKSETAPVPDICFTPGTPFYLKFKFSYSF